MCDITLEAFGVKPEKEPNAKKENKVKKILVAIKDALMKFVEKIKTAIANFQDKRLTKMCEELKATGYKMSNACVTEKIKIKGFITKSNVKAVGVSSGNIYDLLEILVDCVGKDVDNNVIINPTKSANDIETVLNKIETISGDVGAAKSLSIDDFETQSSAGFKTETCCDFQNSTAHAEINKITKAINACNSVVKVIDKKIAYVEKHPEMEIDASTWPLASKVMKTLGILCASTVNEINNSITVFMHVYAYAKREGAFNK